MVRGGRPNFMPSDVPDDIAKMSIEQLRREKQMVERQLRSARMEDDRLIEDELTRLRKRNLSISDIKLVLNRANIRVSPGMARPQLMRLLAEAVVEDMVSPQMLNQVNTVSTASNRNTNRNTALGSSGNSSSRSFSVEYKIRLKEEMDRIRMRNMSLSDMRSVLKNIGMSSDWLSRPQLVRALAEAKIDGKISESMMFASDVGGQSGNRVSASTRMQTSSRMNSADGYTLASMRQNPRGSIRSQFRNDVSDAKARNMKANQITAELDRIKRRNLSLADMRTMLQEVGVSTEWLARPQLARALAEAKVDGIISEQRLQNSMNTMSQAEVENRRRAAAASTPIRNDVDLNADRGSVRSSFARRTIAENQARVQASRQSTQQQLQNRRVSTEGDSQRAEFNRFTSQRRRPNRQVQPNRQIERDQGETRRRAGAVSAGRRTSGINTGMKPNAARVNVELQKLKRNPISIVDMKLQLSQVGISTDRLSRPEMLQAMAEARASGLLSNDELREPETQNRPTVTDQIQRGRSISTAGPTRKVGAGLKEAISEEAKRLNNEMNIADMRRELKEYGISSQFLSKAQISRSLAEAKFSGSKRRTRKIDRLELQRQSAQAQRQLDSKQMQRQSGSKQSQRQRGSTSDALFFADFVEDESNNDPDLVKNTVAVVSLIPTASLISLFAVFGYEAVIEFVRDLDLNNLL